MHSNPISQNLIPEPLALVFETLNLIKSPFKRRHPNKKESQPRFASSLLASTKKRSRVQIALDAYFRHVGLQIGSWAQ